MSNGDTPLFDQTAEELGATDPQNPLYIKQVDHLPDDDYPETIDAPDQQGDPRVDGNDTPNGGR